MLSLIEVSLFFLGAIVASFMGVVSARLYTGQSFIVGRSLCDACGTPLSVQALVPIFSYLLSGGRAGCCGARLSLAAPLTELLLGAFFVLAYWRVGLTLSLPVFLAALSVLLALVLYDLAHQILPTPLLVVFVAASAASGFLLAPTTREFLSVLGVAVLIGGSLALIHIFSRGKAMGFADAPLAFGLALLVGPSAFTGFVFSFWIGAIIGIVLLFLRPAGSRMRVEVPFAPFLASGFLLAYFTQWNIVDLFSAASLWWS
ncbi:MAG: hypothetical protein RLZZ26_65 [Candidatus Parcubacteria bacterium]|jgi:prepilin signal peptidase PulO-like enzyme (type II secretory pathway)